MQPYLKKSVPIVYAFIYKRLKEKNSGIIVRTRFLKECIMRILCWSPKNHHGIPRVFIHDIIKDMENHSLIKRLNYGKYQILKNNCENQINKFVW